MVRDTDTGDPVINFHVDPRTPEVWRRPPYYAAIKYIALCGLRGGMLGPLDAFFAASADQAALELGTSPMMLSINLLTSLVLSHQFSPSETKPQLRS